MLDKTKKFLQSVWLELKKVSWPDKKELIDSTIVVIVAIIILGAVVAVVDQITSMLINKILSL